MKKTKKTMAIVIVLLAIALVGGTLAYFTDKTETYTNTFTVGKVDIELDEPSWEDEPVLMPGIYVEKDPTVTVAEDSEDSYLFVELDISRYMGYAELIAEINGKAIKDLTIDELRAGIDEFIKGINHPQWEVMNQTELLAVLGGINAPTHLKLVLGYKHGGGVLSAGEEVVVFEKIGLPDWVTQDMKGHKTLIKEGANPTKLKITAYAIQAEGLSTFEDAYLGLVGDLGPIGSM